MLKKFTVGNFLSFHHHQTFTMSSASTQRTIQTPHGTVNQFSAIFGENKENLFKAIEYAKTICISGTGNALSILYSPAHPSNKETPSSFDFEICVGENIYSIGFEIDTTRNEIVEQWLIDIAKGKKEILYYINTITGNYTYKEDLFSEEEFLSIVKTKETHFLIISDTSNVIISPDNNVTRDSIFSSIVHWFSSLTIINDVSSLINTAISVLPLSYNLYEIANVFEGKITRLSDDKRKHLQETTKDEISDNLITVYDNSLCFRIKTLDKTIWYEAILEEKNNEYLHILAVLLTKNEYSSSLIHDINTYLSPTLTKSLVNMLFLIAELKNIQCMITTEETSLLDTNFLKKNEIWFVTSGEFLASRLISYDCFFFDKDKDIASAYRNGEFKSI